VFQPDDEAVTAPKFNIVTIDKGLGLLDCFRIASANHRLRAYKMPIVPDKISSILYHPRPSTKLKGFCRSSI
jgi:hypothetical protein